MQLQFESFLHTDMTQVLDILTYQFYTVSIIAAGVPET